MHAPRRAYAPPRAIAALDTTDGDSASPAFNLSSAEVLVAHEQLRNSRRINKGVAPVPSSLTNAGLSSSSTAAHNAESPTLTHKQHTDHLSPRAMWRAPTPRRVPLPDLLPDVTKSRISRVSRPARAPHNTFLMSPARAADNNTPMSVGKTQAGRSDDYGEEYMRLVFDSPRSTSDSVDASQQQQKQCATTTTTYVSRRPLASSTTHTITDAQAMAALAQLPDHFPTHESTPAPLHTASTSASVSSPQHKQQHQALSAANEVQSAQIDAPQPEAWWSSLDGTLSAYNSLHGNAHTFHGAGAGADFQSLRLATPQSTQNLNDTLGRADRAAMVLSMSCPQCNSQGAKVAEDSSKGAVAPMDDHKHGGNDEEEAGSAGTAVATLAARLTRAMENGNAGSNNNSVLAETTASTLACQNTIQELHDTLRMTEVNLCDPRKLQQPQVLLHTSSFNEAPDGGSLSLHELSPLDAQQRLPTSNRGDHNILLPSIVKHSQQHHHFLQNDKGQEAEKAPGLLGAGTKRTRDALARLYATPNTNTAAATTGAVAEAAPTESSFSFLNRDGPSFAAPAPPVSTDIVMRTMPWRCATLSLATMERRYGPLEAVHSVRRSRQTRLKTKQQLSDPQRRISSAVHRGTASARSGQHTKQQKQQLQQQPRLPPSPTSSVSSTIFSCVSLSSSIFLQELGDGEALRKSYMSLVSKKNIHAFAGRDQGKASNATQHRDRDGASRAQPGQQQQPQTQKSAAEEAAELYRREQQRLYASHLTTSSRPQAGGAGGNYGGDAIEPYLDVDYLFADMKIKVKDYTASKGETKAAREENGGATSGALEVGRSGTAKGADNVPALLLNLSVPRDPLQDALQARQALLCRHVQESPAWERLLHKVRQWCDRTQVMIRLPNGECVEQTGAQPPQLSRFKQAARQQTSQKPFSQEGDPDAENNGTSGFGRPTLPTSTNSNASVNNNTDDVDEQQQQCYTYVDDPVMAHDLLMQQVEQEVEDIQRRNALDRCRQRQQQREAVLSESTLSTAETLQPSMNGSFMQLNWYACASRRSTGTGPTWARASFHTDASSSFLVASTGNKLEVTSPDAVTVDHGQWSSVHDSMGLSSHQGYPRRVSGKNDYLTRATTARNESGVESPSAPLTRTTSATRFRAPAMRSPTSQHAALCSKFQTWGSPIEEEDDVDAADDDEEADAVFSSDVREQGAAGALVLWKGNAAHPSETMERGSDTRTPLLSFKKKVDLSQAPSPARRSRTSSIKSISRASLFCLSNVEKDLCAFVLTCGSSSHASSSATDDGLLSLLYLSRNQSTTQRHPQLPVMGQCNSVAATQRALVAIMTILRDGLGVPPTPLPNDDVGGDSFLKQERRRLARTSSVDFFEGDSPSPLWEALLSTTLEGYNVFDFCFVKRLHEALWTYEGWCQRQEKEQPNKCEPARRRSPGVTILPTTTTRHFDKPPLVFPLTLSIFNLVSTLATAKSNDSNKSARATSVSSTVSSIIVDAADLFCALATTPTLLTWLLDAHQSSPTSSWMDIVDSMPTKQQQEWHAVVAECVEKAMNETLPPLATTTPEGLHHASLSTTTTTAAAPLLRQRSLSQSHDRAGAVPISAFSCDVPVTLSAMIWRQRTLHDLIKRALALMEANPQVIGINENGVALSRTEFSVSPAPPSGPFPCVGSTPYLPDEEGRVNYPLDMRNGYLFSSLAREDVENRVVPQLKETRRQYAGALRAARTAATATSAAKAVKTAPEVPPALSPKASTSLPSALLQRVHLHGLMEREQRFISLLTFMWSQERTICAYNAHVGAFNEFTRMEQQRWGPLYRSSLTIAYCVCEELAEKKMENLSTDLLPFVSVVAAFVGCRGGHREMRTKLRAVMLDLVERAKKVQVHVDALLWQGKRAQVLEEAVAAAQLAPRRAGAVVSCLATESDVIGVPLTEVALPAVRLKDSLPLPPQED